MLSNCCTCRASNPGGTGGVPVLLGPGLSSVLPHTNNLMKVIALRRAAEQVANGSTACGCGSGQQSAHDRQRQQGWAAGCVCRHRVRVGHWGCRGSMRRGLPRVKMAKPLVGNLASHAGWQLGTCMRLRWRRRHVMHAAHSSTVHSVLPAAVSIALCAARVWLSTRWSGHTLHAHLAGVPSSLQSAPALRLLRQACCLGC